jgi:2-dehydro-3-deoxygalactonokinase
MRPLVAVDWGTSSLRAARIAADGAVLEERSWPRGILTVPAGGFPEVLEQSCGDWLDDANALCLISGMAGSRQGWMEAPYCPCPAGFAEVARSVTWVQAGRIAIVPGLSCERGGVPDVMRGEEVQVFGALSLLGMSSGRFVLPGTHSKWVDVADGRVQSFATFMTGEFFALLREHSILGRGMPTDDGALDEAAFSRGVMHAQAQPLLHAAFSARTLSLFDRLPPAALPSYLSGLVIGEELRGNAQAGGEVVIVGSTQLSQRYALALGLLGMRSRSLGAEAGWRGTWALARSLENAA